MAGQNTIQCLAESCTVQIALQAQSDGDVIGFADTLHLRQKPEPLLGKRQRQMFGSLHRGNGRQCGARSRRKVFRKIGQDRVSEQIADRHFHAQDPPHAGSQTDRQQGVAAEREEVVVSADPVQLEDIGPDLSEQGFELTNGRLVSARGIGIGVRSRQGSAVQLAVGRQRQRLQPHIGGRHHVFRKNSGQVVTQPLRTELACFQLICIRHGIVGNQTFIPSRILARHHDRFAYRWVFAQPGFNLTQLDAEAADLDLEVVATQELDVAVGKPAAQISGPVHSGLHIPGERIANKALRRKLRPVQITTRYPRPANVQLSHYAYRYRLPIPIQYVNLRVRDRSTDRNTAGVLRHGCDFICGCEGGCLSRTIAIDQMLGRIAVQHTCNYSRGERFTANKEITQLWPSIDEIIRVLIKQTRCKPERVYKISR